MNKFSLKRSKLPCIDIQMAEHHCRLLDPSDVPHLFLSVPEAPGVIGKVQCHFGRLADAVEALEKAQLQGCGVFIAVNVFKGIRRRKADVVRVRAVHRDLDQPSPKKLPLRPSLSVETSPGRRQDYFLCQTDDPLSLTEATRINRQLAERYGGDLKACDISRVLRLAGSQHLKREPHPVHITDGNGQRYSRDELLTAFPLPVQRKAPLPRTPLVLHDDRYVAAAVRGIVRDLAKAAEGSRNSTLNWSSFRLAQLGLHQQEVASQLTPTAQIIGLCSREITATIKSGWQAGAASALAQRGAQ